MKKKIILALVATVVAIFACFAFAGCGAEFVGNTDLQMNKRYIQTGSVGKSNDKQEYYIFYSNGTGEYRYYASSFYDGKYYDHIVKFKYTFVDSDKSAVACFYDSVEYGPDNEEEHKVSTKWTRLLTVSKNVLCWASTSGYWVYINEDYLNSTLTNYGK